MSIVIIAPCAMLPESLNDVWHALLELRIAVLARSLACQFSIDRVTATFEYESTTLKILSCTILTLILALRVCAHLYYCY